MRTGRDLHRVIVAADHRTVLGTRESVGRGQRLIARLPRVEQANPACPAAPRAWLMDRHEACSGSEKMRPHLPSWATQFAVGMALVLVAVAVFSALLGVAVRGPTAFFDELGRTVARLAPQPQPDIRDDAQLRAVIKAMPDGKIQVGSIVEEKDLVVFTATAPRAAVKAAVKPGDQLRIARDGTVEIVPTGIPGFFDQLRRNVEELKRRFFGGP